MGRQHGCGAAPGPGAPRAVVGVMHVAFPSSGLCPHLWFAARCTAGQAARVTPTVTDPPEPDRLAAPPTERKAYAPAPPGQPTKLSGDGSPVSQDRVQHINYFHLTNTGEPLDVLA